MRPPELAILTLLATFVAVCQEIPHLPQQYTATNITTLIKIYGTPVPVYYKSAFGGSSPSQELPRSNSPDSQSPADSTRPAAPPQTDGSKHDCRGGKLTVAQYKLCDCTDSQFSDHDIDYDYDGTMRACGEFGTQNVGTCCFLQFRHDPEDTDGQDDDIEVGDQRHLIDGDILIQNAPVLSLDDGGSQTSDENLNLTSRDLVRTANANLWHDCVCRGEKLIQACKNSKDKAVELAAPIYSPWDGTMEAEFKLWGYQDEPADSHCSFEDIETALKALKIGMRSGMEGGNNFCYKVLHSLKNGQAKDQTYEVNGQKLKLTGPYSIIGANAVSGVIFFVDVRSAYHAAEELWYPEVPTAETLPKLRTVSDISWAFWNRVWQKRPTKKQNLGNINYFIVHNIVNKETEQLIEKSLEVYDFPEGQQRVAELPQWPGLTFDIETEAGQAMLGSPNVIAAGYFLSQHKAQMGVNKYIHQVQIFASDWGYGPSMIFYVKNAPPPASLDSKRSQDRSQLDAFLRQRSLSTSGTTGRTSKDVIVFSRGDDDTFWMKYVCRGEKLTQASMRNKDTAIKFVAGIDSQFDGTMEAELKTWGYTDHKGKSLYCELDNIAVTLNSIGVDANFKEKNNNGQNECFHVEHRRQSEAKPVKEQTYDVDGKTYRMTGAYSHMGVNARDGVVSFLNVMSAERGATSNWKVDKPTEQELPTLRQISDLAWGFWNRAHPDGVGINNINKFLVHNVINSDILKLIKMALKTYQVPQGQQRYTILPKWPGLEFDIDEPEGKALLGSPNGMAAGYFLIQHKNQLGGNKYVHKVTVWKDSGGDEQMLFWVRNAPLPPEEELEQDRSRTPTPDKEGVVSASGMAAVAVEHNLDGRNIIREHRVLARL